MVALIKTDKHRVYKIFSNVILSFVVGNEIISIPGPSLAVIG